MCFKIAIMIILQKHALTATLKLMKGYPTQAHDRGLHSSHTMICKKFLEYNCFVRNS
jgi:hypothetical protein